MMKRIYLLGIAFAICNIVYSQSVFINEIHYDNDAGDINEGVEIAGPYSTNLTGYSIALYNGGNDSVYSTTTLSGTIPNNENYRGVLWFPISPIQNGPDGIALVDPNGNVIQFLSYEGIITAANGPAIGMNSTNIGVAELGSEINKSLQLTGFGTEYADFSWALNPITATRNTKNTSQNFTSQPFVVTNGAVSGLNYELGLGGPSNEGNFSVSGYNLTSDITINSSSNFEISLTSGGVFGTSLVLSEMLGEINATTIFVRLKTSLPIAYYNENITLLSTGITTINVAVRGSVFQKESLVITGVIDGPLSGGTPKAIELYVINDIPDLSIYGVGVANNGEGTDGEEFTFPNVSIAKNTYLYLTNNSPDFTSFFGFAPNYSSIIFAVNGNDAVELFENGSVIDVFGDPNVDGIGQPWEYTDGWAYRTTAGPNTTFTSLEWDYSGVGALVGENTNGTATTPFPIGTYDANALSVVKNNIEGFKMYPNPVTNGKLQMTSNNQAVKNVEIYSLNGQQVYKKEIYLNETINVSHLPKGFYFVKILEGRKIATRKLLVN